MTQKIIDELKQMKPIKKAFHASVALIIWSILLFLLIRLITAAIWFLLGSTVYRDLGVSQQHSSSIQLLGYIFVFAVIILVADSSWSYYNYLHFGRLHRRKTNAHLKESENFANFVELTAKDIQEMQKAKYINYQKDDQGPTYANQ